MLAPDTRYKLIKFSESKIILLWFQKNEVQKNFVSNF